MPDRELLLELRPEVERLLDRHLAASKEWFPHELVPWSRGRDFAPDEPFDPEEFPLPDAMRSALLVNLLTEDNLPYYFATIDRIFAHEAWAVWTRRWTAEEMRHAIVIRDYLTVTRAIDPTGLERARMAQVWGGVTPQPPTVADMLVYLCLQELATRISHRNTGRQLPDPTGYEVMARVGADENLHYLFYKDLTAAAIKVAPSEMLPAIDRQVRHFEMPGVGIPQFSFHARAIARSGIYNLSLHHDQIVCPVVLRHWKVEEVDGLSTTAEQARDSLRSYIEKLGRVARRQADRHAERDAGQKSEAESESELVSQA